MITERRQAVVAQMYLHAKSAVLKSQYAEELLDSPRLNTVTESAFLCELAWVVLSAGIAEHVVRRKFPEVSNGFFNWVSASRIVASRDECFANAYQHFGHDAKLNAIIASADIVQTCGFEKIKTALLANPIATLRQFPYIGSVTVHHLAKNLGLQTAKPDRHLSRISSAAGHNDVEQFCKSIAAFVGDDIRTVDTVLWRYATMYPDYLDRLFGPHCLRCYCSSLSS